MIPIQSFGAAETVTGSCHLVRFKSGPVVLIDCGMFQGHTDHENSDDFGFDPREVDILLVTHAHLDHVGRIPKLVKEGFDGRIISLRATLELAEVIMLDSAKIMQEDYKTDLKKAQRRGEEDKVTPPLYDMDDVGDVFNLSIQYADYNKPISLSKGIKATFHNAGHILGSASIQIDYEEDSTTKTIVFSGDLGNKKDLILPPPESVRNGDALYIESTYGDRNHRSLTESIEEFKTAIKDTLINQGNVLIPSFAIERTQEILLLLKQMYYDKTLPECKIFVDSPMAIRATRIYSQYVQELNEDAQAFLEQDGSVFDFPYLHYTLKGEESMAINDIESGCIIIAGSGMCTGGRILHHFKHRLWNARNSVIFVGYQAVGTLGRLMVDGAETIRIYREEIKVRAKTYMINGFSAHADQKELLEWIGQFQHLEKVFLIHGERDKQEIFKTAIQDRFNKTVHIVEHGEEVWV
ncbi:MBL fold metallo-hydrolase RNA specificity domain-containing protein [Hydrogenovibrio marinus]|uniref:Beta-lactamase n=1 Tax=Hydrogenovibrio marinus TaxID=28885 RepID=A0A066ZQJ3_HYDMR|nr:MBL fold metallo-hydrolase [Hydrogenovibrio marinus]KDN96078.1 beta-lactamase [Hydrogenovibrio marinus]BBN58425.1 MBL fold metallo-hydrolase [Hydrogenovibrio marinus]